MKAFGGKTIFLLACIGVMMMLGTIDHKPGARSEAFTFVGIWRGVFQDEPLSIQFRGDGRLILISGGEDGVCLGNYAIRQTAGASHLDITFDRPGWEPIYTLIERIDDDTIRIAHLDEDAPQRGPFGFKAIRLTRADSHVLPDRVRTAAERDQALADALRGDIWFGGAARQDNLDICEGLFRFQFKEYADRLEHMDVCLLEINGRDPPDELLRRFKDHDPPVRPMSDPGEGRGQGFHVQSIIWIDDTHVEVRGGTRLSGSIYILRRENGRWRVILASLRWIA